MPGVMKAIVIHVQRCRGSWCLRSVHWRLGSIEGFTSRSQAVRHAFEMVESMRAREKRDIVVTIDDEDPGAERWAA